MRPFRFIGRFLGDQWRQFTPTGQMLFVFALVAIVVDAGIAYEYGITMSGLHAAGFALVAIGLALLPDQAWQAAEKRDFWTAGILGALSLLILLPVAYQTHVGYGAGVRLGDMQQTGFQHATLEAQKISLTSERENIAMWRQQLADLKARNAQILDRNHGWAVTTKPEALQAQVAALDQKIDNEAKRVRCGTKCEAYKKEKADTLALIEGIERENDLTSRIEATQRVIDSKTAKVADTGFKSSTVVNQNTALGDLWKLVSGKEAPAEIVSLATMGTSSLAFLFMAPAFMIAAGRNRKPVGKVDDPSAPAVVTETIPKQDETRVAKNATPVRHQAPAPMHTREIVRTDENVWRDLRVALRQGQLAA